jgi:seryl-tRNA synthetase
LVVLNKSENQGMPEMSKKPQSKDEALEALDFIVNVLKEHEKDLDKLIHELGTVTEALGETGELTCKVEKVEEKINGLQNEINTLVDYLSTSSQETPVLTSQQKAEVQAEVAQPSPMHGPPVILRCKQWDDFKTLSFQAQTLSFMYKESEKTFQADALKGNQIITYSGELPLLPALLKMWLSKQLEVPEKKILEGVLAIG